MDIQQYLSDGRFELFIPGVRANFALGEISESLVKFLEIKGAHSYVFLTLEDVNKVVPVRNAEEERAYLDSQEAAGMSLLVMAGEMGWWYYLAGFRSNTLVSLGGILVLDTDAERLKEALKNAGGTWLVRGSKTEKAVLELW